MTDRDGATGWRSVKLAALAGLVVWAAASSWYAWHAGRSGSALLLAEDAAAVTPEEQAAAAKFFAAAPDGQKRFLAVVASAKAEEQDGTDVAAVRLALAGAIRAAAAVDAAAVDARVAEAERLLNELALGGPGPSASGVAEMVAAIEPAYVLGRDLLTEGHAAVEKLVGRASREFAAGEQGRAAALLQLAAELSGVEVSSPGVETLPDWFTAMADMPVPTSTQADAEAAVTLAEAMAASESPAPPVMTLVKRARRELDAGQVSEASWWAGVALNALGVTDEAAAGAVGEGRE